MNNEIWKDVPGFNGEYQISNLGSVKSLKFNKEKILKTFDCLGYRKIDLQVDKNRRKYSVHRLVASAFLGLDLEDENSIVNHIDGIRSHNELENLELVTLTENTIDGIKRKAKLTINPELIDNIIYIGVKQWNAYYPHNNKNIFLGEFSNMKEALIAVQTAKLVIEHLN